MSRKFRKIIVLSVLFGLVSCGLKSKTELYLERGLDILSNKEQVNFTLVDGVGIREVGVIRDKKEKKKILVFKMEDQTAQTALAGYRIAVRARIRDASDSVRIEHWEINPGLVEVEGHKYITRDIRVEEDKIQKLYVYLYRAGDEKRQRQGRTLTLNNLWTYND